MTNEERWNTFIRDLRDYILVYKDEGMRKEVGYFFNKLGR